jgi:mannose-6-phosphate isomerase-like protein (cupin superfamily)
VKHFFNVSQLEKERATGGKRYSEFLRVPAISAGLYTLEAGQEDPQTPHKEDEMYFVVKGRARMRVGSEEQRVSPGSVIFVEAGVEHRFHDIQEHLEVLVFFAPAES